jgi:hypothetical protein
MNMADSQLFTKRGYYRPSFLQMKVDAPCDLSDLNTVSQGCYSTFFHEYIHYLQDIGTTFGLNNANIVGNRLKHFISETDLNPSTTFPVPMILPKGHSTTINKEAQLVYLGQSNLGNISPSGVSVNLIYQAKSGIYIPSHGSVNLEEVLVDFSYGGKSNSYKLGAIGLMETMANLIQVKFFPGVSAPAFPYYSGEIVANNIYPIIGRNREFVFALADICLLLPHPGEAFFKMLELMKSTFFVPKDAHEIYDFVHANIKGPNGETLLDIFIDLSLKAEALYLDIFRSPIFVNERAWLKTVISEARNLRIKNPTFMLNLYHESTAKSSTLVSILDILGTPLMFNRNDDAWFHRPAKVRHLDIQPDRLAAILEIFELFELGKKECGLPSYCGMSISTDLRCGSSPWSRCQDSQLCGYAQLWKTWNLCGKTPT